MNTPLIRSLAAGAIALTAVTLSSCTPYQKQGATAGGIVGGLWGAIRGDSTSDIVRGAAIGAGVGAGAAAVKERVDEDKHIYNNGAHRTEPHRPTQPTPPVRPTQPAQPKYPLATRTVTNPNHVLSPYPPHNVIDVTGFKPGELARDKTTGKIFTIPPVK